MRSFLVFLMGCWAVALQAQIVANTQWEAFDQQVYEAEGYTMPYRLYKPKHTNPQQQLYPLIVFLHGAGERGADNELPLTHIAPIVLDPEYFADYNAYVLVPQCAEPYRWVETDWTLKAHDMPETASVPMSALMQLLQELPSQQLIDPQRCYVVGLSMGGYGVWDLLMRMPGYFAAGVPICGGGDKTKAALLKQTPIWAFHGDKDKVVLPARSRDMVDAIKAAGGTKIKYTEYKDVGHGSWKPALRESAMWKWLFEQRLAEK